MSVKVYDSPLGVIIAHVDDENKSPICPGDWVTDNVYGGKGIVVGATDSAITVLWSIEPALSAFSLPNFRRSSNMTLIANELITVQPMTAPAGSIFYLDYKYGAGKLQDDLEKLASSASVPPKLVQQAKDKDTDGTG